MNPPQLVEFLDRIYLRYHDDRYLSSDPLEFVHAYRDPEDQEVVALVSALLAYGNVRQIRRSVEGFLERIRKMGVSPAEFVDRLASSRRFRGRAELECEDFVHRFNRGADLVLLLELVGRIRRREGSLGRYFVSRMDSRDATIEGALDRVIGEFKERARERALPSFSFLLTAPRDGSVCKRWCMLLRWMGRSDALDPGLWRKYGLRPDQLVIPLDTHTGRISRQLGLTDRRSLNWKAALEITANLKKCDPMDPIRYDFALSRLGILREWNHGEITGNC